MAKKKVPVIQVTAKREKFRRAGFEFTHETRTIPVVDLSKEQLKAIKAEAMLVVVEGEMEVATEGSES